MSTEFLRFSLTDEMLYRQRLESCLADAIGGAGITASAYQSVLGETAGGLQRLRARHGDSSLPLLRLPAARDDLERLEPVARRHRESFANVVVLGTGGSSLGGQTLCALADCGFGPRKGSPKLWFMDNIDPHTFAAMFASLDLARTGFIVISKSGATAETLTQFLICLAQMARAVGEDGTGRHFTLITEAGDNVLRRLGEERGFEILDHDPDVGGRFSVLSLVGLLPAMIAGIDAAAIRAGAAEVLAPVLGGAEPGACAPALGAAVSVALNRDKGISTTVLMPYVDRLAFFAMWYRQLWAESLGKDGKGTTPIRAIGTVDQHSQLQLYLAGPRDKMFSIIEQKVAGAGHRVAPGLAGDPALAYLKGRSMGDLLDAEQRATAETLIRNRRPTRVFEIETLDERVMGALLMHFMLETILAADLLGVNAFDQPAVEEGKALAREYLGKM